MNVNSHNKSNNLNFKEKFMKLLPVAVFAYLVIALAWPTWRVGIDDRPTSLVTGGLFAVSRNPIFFGMFLSFLGVVLITPAPWTVTGFTVAVPLVSLQVRLEERNLLRIHGEAYLAYAARVGRFLPWVGRLRSASGIGPEVSGVT
jgi:protein-S-isoprenylcysteine O-methyltransferase Ste14